MQISVHDVVPAVSSFLKISFYLPLDIRQCHIQGHRNEMKGAGAELQKGHFSRKRAIVCKLVGGSPPPQPPSTLFRI